MPQSVLHIKDFELEPATAVTAVTVDLQRPVGTATDGVKTANSNKSKQRQLEAIGLRLRLQTFCLGIIT